MHLYTYLFIWYSLQHVAFLFKVSGNFIDFIIVSQSIFREIVFFENGIYHFNLSLYVI